MVRIHTVSFASEGPPYDEGLPLGRETLIEWGMMCIAGGADTYRWYTPRLLDTEEDSWCIKRYSDEHAMPVNPCYHKVGLGAWRGVILRKTMDEAEDGDVVVVHCSNFQKVPHMKLFAQNLRVYVETVIRFTDLYSPPHASVARYTTKDVLELIPDPAIRKQVASAPMGQCRLIIARVTPRTRDFIRLFEKTMKENPLLLSPHNKQPYDTRAFHRLTAEQSVFNVLAYREGFFPVAWPRTWIEALRHAACHEGSGTNEVIRYGKTLR